MGRFIDRFKNGEDPLMILSDAEQDIDVTNKTCERLLTHIMDVVTSSATIAEANERLHLFFVKLEENVSQITTDQNE